jgi:hypothetical protein
LRRFVPPHPIEAEQSVRRLLLDAWDRIDLVGTDQFYRNDHADFARSAT